MSIPVQFDGHTFYSLADAARYRARQTGEDPMVVYSRALSRLKHNPRLSPKLAFQAPPHKCHDVQHR